MARREAVDDGVVGVGLVVLRAGVPGAATSCPALSFLGENDDAATACRAAAFVVLARSAADAGALAVDYVERRCGPGTVFCHTFVELEGASRASAGDRLRTAGATAGWLREVGLPLLVPAAKSVIDAARDYVVNEYLAPAESPDEVWFLRLQAEPATGGPQGDEVGGAYAVGFALGRTRDQALAAAAESLGREGWVPRLVLASRPASRRDTSRDQRRQLKDAIRVGAAFDFYVWPAGGDDGS